MAVSKRGVELNILEVGLGGRLDATNVFDPIASVVVSIGLDHQNYLGDSLLEILREKLGITRKGCPLFLGDELGPSLDDFLKAYLSEHQIPVFRYGSSFNAISGMLNLTMPGFQDERMTLPEWVLGRPQVMFKRNFALATSIFFWFLHWRSKYYPQEQTGLSVTQRLHKALGLVGAPGTAYPNTLFARFERLSYPGNSHTPSRKIILDVSHNVPATKAFVDSLRHFYGVGEECFLPGIISILADKDMNGMLDLLREVLDPIVLFQVRDRRGFQVEQIAARHKDTRIYSDFQTAWDDVSVRWSSHATPWVIGGSVLAIGEVLSFLQLPIPSHFS